ATEVFRPMPHSKPVPALPVPSAAPRPATRASSGRRQPRTAVPSENILQLLLDAVAPSPDALAAEIADRALRYLGHRPLKLVRHVDDHSEVASLMDRIEGSTDTSERGALFDEMKI